MTATLIRDMFEQVVVAKNSAMIARFYHPDFLMHSNGATQGYRSFVDEHEKVYASAIRYAVEYDEDAWVESADKVAARVWITTSRPGESSTRIEVILIALIDDGRIRQLWETTWPNWAKLDAFENYTTDGGAA